MASSTSVGLAEIERSIAAEFPQFKVVKKSESQFMRLIDVLLRIITVGAMKKFMDSFTTTIGYTVYVPTDWTKRSETTRAITLRHERVHMRQRQKYGFAFNLLYLLALPCYRAFFRTQFEKEAYEESMKALQEYYGGNILASQRENFISYFTGPSYFWMWTKREDIEAWYDSAASRILIRAHSS